MDLNLITLLILLPVMGLSGAAWAMTTGYVVSTVFLVAAFNRATGMGLSETWRPRREDVSYLLDVIRNSMNRSNAA